MAETAPTAFISYAWEDPMHKKWVRDLAVRLRTDGVDVHLDQWEAIPGDQLPIFMERAVRYNDFVLIICTPRYMQKSNARHGGVGYEGDIMTAEVMNDGNHRKFIPILRAHNWDDAAPIWMRGKYYIDLRGTPYDDTEYDKLLATLHNASEKAPPLGTYSKSNHIELKKRPAYNPTGNSDSQPHEIKDYLKLNIITNGTMNMATHPDGFLAYYAEYGRLFVFSLSNPSSKLAIVERVSIDVLEVQEDDWGGPEGRAERFKYEVRLNPAQTGKYLIDDDFKYASGEADIFEVNIKTASWGYGYFLRVVVDWFDSDEGTKRTISSELLTAYFPKNHAPASPKPPEILNPNNPEDMVKLAEMWRKKAKTAKAHQDTIEKLRNKYPPFAGKRDP